MIVSRIGYSAPQNNSVQKSSVFRGYSTTPHKNLKTFFRNVGIVGGIVAVVGLGAFGMGKISEVVQKGGSALMEKYNAMDKAFLKNIVKDIPR